MTCLVFNQEVRPHERGYLIRYRHHNGHLIHIDNVGGCQCAGPYSQMLLGLSNEANKKLEVALLDKHEVQRPRSDGSFTRILVCSLWTNTTSSDLSPFLPLITSIV